MAANQRHVENARALARLLDRAFTIPGTRLRFGLDGLIGLLPGIGDAAGGAMGAYILFAAVRAGVPRSVLARMAANTLLDVAVGAVPLLGDLFDFAFKANTRNMALLDRALNEPEHARRSSRRAIAVVVAGLVAVASLLAIGIAWVVLALVGSF